MLEGILSWMKDILQKNRGLSEPHVSEPRPKPILNVTSNTNAVNVTTPLQSITEPRTRISFAIPPSGSQPLRRSPGGRSLLPRYNSDRTDASRSPLPQSVTPTPSNDLRRTALLGLASRQRATTDPNSHRIATPASLPNWFPSGTISMTSRTTHQTYSTDPSLLFSSPLRNDMLSPLTSAIFTPSLTPKTEQVLESRTRNTFNSVDPSQGRTALNDATVVEMDANPVEREAGERVVWIKANLLPATSVVTRDTVRPSITIRPPTPTNAQTAHTTSPMIPDAVIVDSPEGSVASSRESAHDSDSCKAAAASDPIQSCRSSDGDVTGPQVSDRPVSPSRLTNEVQSHNHTAEIVDVVTPVDWTGVVDVLQTAEAGAADAQNMQGQEWSLPNAPWPPARSRLSPSSWLSPPIAASHTQISGHSPQTVETQGVQTMGYVDLVSQLPDLMHQDRSDNNPNRRSTPISQLNLVQPPPDKIPQVIWPDMPAHVNHIMAPSVNQIPYSVVGPNAFPVATDQFSPTGFVSGFPSCPRYPALSLIELLPFRRPEPFLPPPAILSSDEVHWVTSLYVEIRKDDFPHWQSNGLDDRMRRYTTLGMISKSAGKLKYLVYNRKSRRSPHTLTLVSPMGMDPNRLQLHANHLWFMRCLGQLPLCGNLAVFYGEAPAVWCCPDEYIWYLSPHECGTLDLWNGAVEESQMPLIIRDLANGLDFLHKHDIIHWDLRAHNIFIDRAGYCLIGNFERATLMSYTPRGDLTLEGRRRLDNFSPHTAPELIRNGVPLETYRFNHAVDMWALGMIVCELQVGKINWDLRYTILDLRWAMVSSNAPPELLHLTFEGFLVQDFRYRAVAEAVVVCPYLREAWDSGAPPFLSLDIAPLLPDMRLPAQELDHHQHYMARRHARQELEQVLGFNLPCDESFLVGRDC